MARLERSYIESTKAGAVATAVVTGSSATAATAAGVPARTVRDWVKQWKDGQLGDAELQEEIDNLILEYGQSARGTMAAVVDKGVALLEKGIEHWLEKADQLTPNAMKDLAFVVGIIEDKRRTIEGQPTSLSARIEFSRKEVYHAPNLLRDVPGLAQRNTDPRGEVTSDERQETA